MRASTQLSLPGRRPPARDPAPGAAFTLVEVLIVVMLLGIAVGLALPSLGDTRALRLREAARMLAADFEYAQSESIAHPDNPRLVQFDPLQNRYWIAAQSDPATPIPEPIRGQSYLRHFGTAATPLQPQDPLYHLKGISLGALNVGDDACVRFDAYGSPDQTTDATVQLAGGVGTLTVRVKAGSGDVSVE